MYGYNVEIINLKDEYNLKEVKDFLQTFDLLLDDNVDYTIVIRQNEDIKATCSKSKNVFKCFAISNDLRGEGVCTILLEALTDKLFKEGIYHSFIFTKVKNTDIFISLGYKLVHKIEDVALLEGGIYDIEEYLENIKKEYNIISNIQRSAIVMNCNPFTLGHMYLIEEAARQSAEVLVFIVEEDKSSFPFIYRYSMVKEGVSHLNNVRVIKGGEYIISQATFPSYFLRKEDVILKAYTTLDASIFGRYFCKALNITKRFIGEEPYCKVTNAYNEALKQILPTYGTKVVEIKRKAIMGAIISASNVRKLIKEDQINHIEHIVPISTWKFLNTLVGKEIVEKIRISDSPH
ncbi:[citrate (pro-3S)-lyase] ligase [Clostridium estertheticum]|uniref:[Citrate [pro-3S]-lyase] ligase n=1 Tax=Clostridium estertheticum TaxID=238834 RepID=A0A5N7IZS2_9CLOT|nr:[citrate (pro-3S)-lyase] ligase [Clostridium estertheticum]MPQ31297.1 [citrate (pro-3S)-lyase] ligase [Clostridium estertheticum]MPQ61971.1 [citrate (pro-3S)-lyase] ligase [Clostridium estertheticum]